MDPKLKSNLTSKKHWTRFLYMLLFAVLFYVAFLVSWLVIVVQFVFTLISGDDSDKLRTFGSSLSQYMSQTLNYLTYNSEAQPFPMSEWPEPIPVSRVSDAVEDENLTSSETNGLNTHADIADQAEGEIVPQDAVKPVERAFANAEDTQEPNAGEPVAVEEKIAARKNNQTEIA